MAETCAHARANAQNVCAYKVTKIPISPQQQPEGSARLYQQKGCQILHQYFQNILHSNQYNLHHLQGWEVGNFGEVNKSLGIPF